MVDYLDDTIFLLFVVSSYNNPSFGLAGKYETIYFVSNLKKL